MTHHLVIIKINKKNFLVKFSNLEPFPQNFFSEFDKFLMGHSNLTKLIGLFNKTLKMSFFFKKTFIFAITVRFWINDAQRKDKNGSTASCQ